MDLGTLYTIYKDNTTNFRILGGFLIAVLIVGGYVQTILLNTLIFGYLCYKTIELLTLVPHGDDSEVLRQKGVYYTECSTDLLKQWVVFSSLIVLEYFLGFLVGIIYTSLKLALFVFLLQDNPNIFLIYNFLIIPVYTRYQSYISQLFSFLELKANTLKTREPGDPSQIRKSYNVLYWLTDKLPFLERFVSRPKLKKIE